ncbi:hypothetical protein [uncultured Ruminococcus sp.]|nr:hypothetical protein [uncultured Ruminococcus sp.]
MQKFVGVADLPLKSGKSVVLVTRLFLCCCRILMAFAVVFKSPNSKPFGY